MRIRKHIYTEYTKQIYKLQKQEDTENIYIQRINKQNMQIQQTI